jgi:four helix bundle protein
MKSKSFENLRVYRLSEELADCLWEVIGGWKGLARDTVGKQAVRAADGIGANIAEGYGRGTYADNRRFVRMARGSLYEVRHWLPRSFRRGLLKTNEVNKLKTVLDNLGPQLNNYLKSIGATKPRDQ